MLDASGTLEGQAPMKFSLPASAIYVVALTTAACSAVAAEPPARHNWKQGASLPFPLDAAMAGAIKGKIIITGGAKKSGLTNATEIYDPVADTYTAGAKLPIATCCGASAVVNNLLYIFGGTNASGATDAVWAYDPVANSWTAKAPMPNARSSEGAAAKGNIAYVVGGNDNNELRLNTVESYDAKTDAWAELPPLITGKSEPSVVLFGDAILAAGGYTAQGDTGDSESYDIASNTWTSLPNEPVGLNESCSGVLVGNIWILGGTSNGPAVQNTFRLDPHNDSPQWYGEAPLPHAEGGMASATYKNSIYCFGGTNHDVGGTLSKRLQIFTP